MSDERETSYAFAVARIRALEGNLLDRDFLEQMIAAKDVSDCMQMLADRGWGGRERELPPEELLAFEAERTKEELEGLLDDTSALEIIKVPDLYHNLKAAVKDSLTQGSFEPAYLPGTEPSGQKMREIILSQDYQALPGELGAVAKEAYETLLRTRDGQLCDILVDRAALQAMYDAAMSSDEPVIRDYGRTLVDVADIRIAVRACRTGKNADFFRQAMVRTESIDPEEAAKASASGEEALFDYLRRTRFSEAVDALEISQSAFECWCDDRVIESIRPQLYQSFTMGPVIAWSIAREMEIKTVRIILTGKANGLTDEAIRERMRETYV